MLPQVATVFDPIIGVLMTPRPITIVPDVTLDAAGEVMRGCRIRHLPVVDGATLLGVLSLRDVIAGEPRTLVREAMSAPETLDPSAPLTLACDIMLARRFSCLPVVEQGRLVGVFTATDALAFAVDALEDDARELGREPDVGSVMTSGPLTVIEPNASLRSAWELMRAARIRHLPVVSDGNVVGMLSDRDLLAVGRRTLEQSLAHMLVVEAMSSRVSVIGVERPAVEAAKILLRRRVGALPVLRGHALRGIITVSDFLYWIVGRA